MQCLLGQKRGYCRLVAFSRDWMDGILCTEVSTKKPFVASVWFILLTCMSFILLRCLYKYSWSKKDNQIGKGDDSLTCSNTESLTTKDQWKLLLKDPNYSSYSVLALSPSRKVIAFGNLQGNIKLQDTGE